RHTRFSRDWSSDVCSSDLCSCPDLPARARGDVQGRLVKIGDDPVRNPEGRILAPLGLATVVEEDRAAARAPARLDIVENVADEPGAPQVQAQLARRAIHERR